MEEKMMLYAILAVGIVIFAFTLYTTLTPQYSQADYRRALAAQLPDKCATPPGYTDESWRQHMGHHPDQYAECLG
ncbi:MAG: hypothetical protein HYW27_02815 [Candidatus Aenigmarchaeota archaeon]|nr:hypothetical protein [Candidatus Aenigmarchaeota archaeon]